MPRSTENELTPDPFRRRWWCTCSIPPVHRCCCMLIQFRNHAKCTFFTPISSCRPYQPVQFAGHYWVLRETMPAGFVKAFIDSTSGARLARLRMAAGTTGTHTRSGKLSELIKSTCREFNQKHPISPSRSLVGAVFFFARTFDFRSILSKSRALILSGTHHRQLLSLVAKRP